jgi:putative addiction module component (TIGR02574 family)
MDFIGGWRNMLGKADILNLSVSERIQLVQDIWDSIAEVPDSVPLTDEQKAELDRRLDAYHRDPNAGSPWSVVRERFKSRA